MTDDTIGKALRAFFTDELMRVIDDIASRRGRSTSSLTAAFDINLSPGGVVDGGAANRNADASG